MAVEAGGGGSDKGGWQGKRGEGYVVVIFNFRFEYCEIGV